jgi:hypothetical protein
MNIYMIKLLTQIIFLQKIYMKKKKNQETRNEGGLRGLRLLNGGIKGGEEERHASTHQCESGLCS